MIAFGSALMSIEPSVLSAMALPHLSLSARTRILPAVDDARRILLLRGARAFAYGFTSVLLGIHLADVLSPAKAGAILTATLAGSAALTAGLGVRGHRIGRRRAHIVLSVAMAAAMTVFAFTTWFPALILAAL